VRSFRRYRLVFFLLIYGAFLYVLVPPIFNDPDSGDGAVLPKDAATAAVSQAVDRPAHAFEDYRAIWEQNVFKTGKSESAAKEAPVDEIPPADADLGLKLVGTVVMENSGKSLAMLEREDTGLQESCWEGGRLGRVLIKKILQDKVIVDAGAGEVILSMGPLRTTGEGEVTIAKDSLETENVVASATHPDLKEEAASLPNYLLLMKARNMRTVFQEGKPYGILIYRIDPESLFGKIGLQDGDVIKAVNGESLSVSMDAVEIYNRLKHGGRTSFTVQRGEENVELQFDVT
jgi:general secretion pathway protein C